MRKPSMKRRVQELLDFARSLKDSGLTWVEANNAIYGPGGRFVTLFPTKADRVAFARTEESHKIDELVDSLPEPDVRSSRVGVQRQICGARSEIPARGACRRSGGRGSQFEPACCREARCATGRLREISSLLFVQ